MPEKIVICDDDVDNVNKWTARLKLVVDGEGRFNVEAHTLFLPAIQELEARRLAARKGESRAQVPTLFDSAAILVVDYDLLELGKDQNVTGEAVAYLARCYSTCGVIILLNQRGANRYDLTLRGHPESFADLNIGAEQLHNAALWGKSATGFAPWAWAVIPDILDRHRRRVDDLQRNGLGRSIASVLGLTDEAIGSLARSAREFIEVDDRRLTEITFGDIAAKGGPMLEPKDDLADDGARVNVASARVARWCEDWLLPDQDLLIDAPHLVLRYPSLLEGNIESVETWNAVCDRRSGHQWHPAPGHMGAYEFAAKDWLSRPAWWGKRLGENTQLREVVDPWTLPPIPFVFCEDVGRFAPLEAARSFIADLESPHVKRFVSSHDSPFFAAAKSELEQIDYQPMVRLSQ